VNEATISRADALACQYDLRGYDAVHLACAILLRESLAGGVSLATFDRLLWKAGQDEGFTILPENLV
jgi:predicted nucleic acid-binding protein